MTIEHAALCAGDLEAAREELYEFNIIWDQISKYSRNIPLILGGSVLIEILLAVYLFCSAGHKRSLSGEDTLVQGGFHKIPFDIVTCAACVGVVLAVIVWDELEYSVRGSSSSVFVSCGLMAAYGTVLFAGLMVYLETMAVRIKCHTLFDGMVIVRLIRWMGN